MLQYSVYKIGRLDTLVTTKTSYFQSSCFEDDMCQGRLIPPPPNQQPPPPPLPRPELLDLSVFYAFLWVILKELGFRPVPTYTR